MLSRRGQILKEIHEYILAILSFDTFPLELILSNVKLSYYTLTNLYVYYTLLLFKHVIIVIFSLQKIDDK